MNCDFKSGDEVCLKSGSPNLTVARVEGDSVSVVWYCEATYIFQTDDFPAACLEKKTLTSA